MGLACGGGLDNFGASLFFLIRNGGVTPTKIWYLYYSYVATYVGFWWVVQGYL